MNDQPKPIALNLMEIWRTGRQLEQPNVVWRAVNRDHSPASEWRPINPSFAKKALRAGVFSCTHEGERILFATREFPGARAQLSDYARLKELITARKTGKALEPFNAGEPQAITSTDLQAMENPEPAESVVSDVTQTTDANGSPILNVTVEVPLAAVLDAAADAVIAEVTAGVPEELRGEKGSVEVHDEAVPVDPLANGLAVEPEAGIPALVGAAPVVRSIHEDMELADGHGNSVHAPAPLAGTGPNDAQDALKVE